MARALSLFLSVYLILTSATNATAQSQSVNFAHPDNLVRTHKLSCLSLDEVINAYTPADISRAIQSCANRGRFEQAIQLFFLYSVYGYYDQERMVDMSARGAIGVLNSEIFQSMSARQRDGMTQAAQRLQDTSGSFFRNTCNLVRKIGPPVYVPIYMAAHGLKALNYEGDKVEPLKRQELSRLIENVDAERLWNESLHEINRCPR